MFAFLERLTTAGSHVQKKKQHKCKVNSEQEAYRKVALRRSVKMKWQTIIDLKKAVRLLVFVNCIENTHTSLTLCFSSIICHNFAWQKLGYNTHTHTKRPCRSIAFGSELEMFGVTYRLNLFIELERMIQQWYIPLRLRNAACPWWLNRCCLIFFYFGKFFFFILNKLTVI